MKLIHTDGKPVLIRSDNGPEFVATALENWLKTFNIGTSYITPGSPWENPYIESFNGKFRDECLNREMFTSLLEAKIIVDDFVLEYNNVRPHSSLNYMTPNAFAQTTKQVERKCLKRII